MEKPALAPPPGDVSDFVHPDSLMKWTVVTVTVCLSIVTVLFVLRVYVRALLKRDWVFEDSMVAAAWAGLLTYCALMTTVNRNHGGVHEWDLTVPQVHQALYWFNATSVVYGVVILLTKLAILLLYRRVFVAKRGTLLDWILRAFMLILILFYVATNIVKIWECTPRERIWNKSVQGTCVNISALLNASGLFNTITDVIILLIPVRSVWSLQMDTQRKVGIIMVFTVGFTAPAFSIVGFVVRLRTSGSPDLAYNGPLILLWATAEISTGLICVCVPTLAPLAHRRTPTKPTASIVAGASGSRRMGSRKPESADEQELWDRGDMELQQQASYSSFSGVGGGPLKGTVVTGIQGGVRESIKKQGSREFGSSMESMDGTRQPGGILTTVSVEQSYV